jgi:hypothetical protein
MKLLIIGTGWADTHARNFASMAGVEIVAVVEIDKARLLASPTSTKSPIDFSILTRRSRGGASTAPSTPPPTLSITPRR